MSPAFLLAEKTLSARQRNALFIKASLKKYDERLKWAAWIWNFICGLLASETGPYVYSSAPSC